MRGILIKTAVADNVDNIYEKGAFIPFAILLQNQSGNNNLFRGGQRSAQREDTLEYFVRKGTYEVTYRAYKNRDDATTKKGQGKFFPLHTQQGDPVGQVVVTLTPEESKGFSEKLLNQKVLEYFAGIFGEGNVELAEE